MTLIIKIDSAKSRKKKVLWLEITKFVSRYFGGLRQLRNPQLLLKINRQISNQIRYAWNLLLKKIIHISEAEKGLSCQCVCAECNGELEAVKGEIREHYFRHSTNRNCNGETAIHLFAKQVIAENTAIKLPGRRLFYTNARIETRLDTRRPDVTVWANNEEVHFEVRVSNAVKAIKKQFYYNAKHKCVEIDLSDRSLWLLPPEKLKQIILEETYNKYIVFWEEEKDATVYEDEPSYDFRSIVVFISAVLLIMCAALYFKKRRKQVFRYY